MTFVAHCTLTHPRHIHVVPRSVRASILIFLLLSWVNVCPRSQRVLQNTTAIVCKGRITLAVRGAVGVDVAIHFSTNPRESVPRGIARFWFHGRRSSRHDRQPTRQQTMSIPLENRSPFIFRWDRNSLLASRLAIVAAAKSLKPESCNTARNQLTRIG